VLFGACHERPFRSQQRDRRERRERRAEHRLRPDRRRGALVQVLGREPRLRGERRPEGHARRLRRPDAAAQRDGLAPHGARAAVHARGRARPVEPHAREEHALAARHRPRRHRHADRRRASARARREDQARPRASGVRGAGLEVEGGERRAHRPPAADARRLPRLASQQVHDGSGHEPGRARGVRSPAPGRPHVPRHAPHQLVPGVPDRALGPRGGARGGGERRALRVRVQGRRRRHRDHRRHHPARDDARRHRRRRPPGRPALHAPPRQEARAPVRRPQGADHHRRDPGRHEVRHRRREGHACARLQRLRDGEAPRPRRDQHLRQARSTTTRASSRGSTGSTPALRSRRRSTSWGSRVGRSPTSSRCRDASGRAAWSSR